MKQYRVHDLVKNSIISICKDVGSSLSLQIADDLQNGITKKYVVEPHTYEAAMAYRHDAQLVAMVNKNGYLTKASTLRAKAIEKFIMSEDQCFNTNVRIKQALLQPRLGANWALLYEAKSIIAKLLGDCPKPLIFDYGPGATYSLKAGDATIVAKLSDVYECTPHCYDYLMSNFRHNITLAFSTGILARNESTVIRTSKTISIVKGARYTTVPKDALTDRSICIEPLGNMMCQKALGNQIRTAMKKSGVDLDLQATYHNRLAMQGSLDGSIATIDLSAASDTISLELVRFLLPHKWFDAIDATRSKSVFIENQWRRLEKVSSMGNGYTWELESMIFYALARAVRKLYGSRNDVVSVFGDDIIVTSELSPILLDLLTHCGFAINNEKTFTTGPFRESCGKDYFSGIDVRPIFIKKVDTNDRIEVLYNLVNRICEISFRLGLSDNISASTNAYCKDLLHRIPKHLRCYGPCETGDRTLRGEPRTRTRNYISEMKMRFSLPSKECLIVPKDSPEVELAYALLGMDSAGIAPRGARFFSIVRYAPGWWHSTHPAQTL